MIKLYQMALEGINWVYNTKIRSNGLERSQLGTHWWNYVKFHQNLQFSSKSTIFRPKIQFSPKSTFSSKSAIFIKIHSCLPFLSELSRGQHQIGILCETKDHLPRKVTPIFLLLNVWTHPLSNLKLNFTFGFILVLEF